MSLAVLARLGCSSVSADDAKIFAISGSDVTAAKVVFQKSTPTTLELTLTAEKAKELADTTESNIGKTIQIHIEGESVSTPVVKEKVAGPNLQITTKDEEQALKLARGLTTSE